MTWISEYQRWLSESESLHNAQIVADHFSEGWTSESISALCGNMRHESSINPDMYEYGYDWEDNRGFGLVQWTPRSKYWDWAVSNGLSPRNGNSQLARIDYEVENNIQWIANGHAQRYGLADKYDITFLEFRENTHNYNINELTEAFMWNYEGPNYQAGQSSLVGRQSFAAEVYQLIEFGNPPIDPPDGETDNKIYHLLLSGALNGW